LFRPALLSSRHKETVDQVIAAMIRPLFDDVDTEVRVDMVELIFKMESLMMAMFVGIELPDDPADAVEDIRERMRHINDMASLVWSKNDPMEDAWRVRHQLVDFAETYLLPAIRRARDRDPSQSATSVIETMVDGFESGTMDGELVAREAWMYMAGGVQTSTYTILDTLPHLLGWLEEHPEDREKALDPTSDFLVRVISESVRLDVPNPAIFRIAIRSGTTPAGREYEEGDQFALYTGVANRDPEFFGDDATEFNPYREMREGVPRWGFAFGHGPHACIGRALALGRVSEGSEPEFEGSTVSIIRALVACGMQYDPTDMPQYREDTFKAAFKSFTVRLTHYGLE
jgi:cytochrome P450